MSVETNTITPTPIPEVTQSQPEYGDRLREEVVVAYLGVREFIARQRMNLAGRTMERMDHKDALYTDLGKLALTGERGESDTATGELAMPRTIVERRMDLVLDKKARKKRIADVHAYHYEKIYKPRGHLRGMDDQERKDAKRGIYGRVGSFKSIQNRQLLAGEARIEALKVDGARLKFGEEELKKSARKQRRTNKRLDRRANQRGLQRPLPGWRENKRQRAIGRIKTQYRQIEAIEQEKEKINQLSGS